VKLAEAQHGVVTHAQLLALGMGRSAVKSRVRRGALCPLAAVLACGEGAVLSHLSAARLWSMSGVPVDRAVPAVVVALLRRALAAAATS
jgi:hypothetical protein